MHVTLNEESQSLWQSQQLEHLRYEYDLQPAEINRRYGCAVVMVEPGPWILGCNAGEIINKAASTYNGKQTLGGAYYYTSSHEDGEMLYDCFDVNSLLMKHEEIALLKINIEGAEYELLEHIYRGGLIPRSRDLQVQFHLIEGEDSIGRYEAISDLLLETHSPTWRYMHCWENWRRDA